MPMIGSGLANGDWSEIEKIIEFFSNKVESKGGTVTVVEYKP
jgi:hypothetical protein